MYERVSSQIAADMRKGWEMQDGERPCRNEFWEFKDGDGNTYYGIAQRVSGVPIVYAVDASDAFNDSNLVSLLEIRFTRIIDEWCPCNFEHSQYSIRPDGSRFYHERMVDEETARDTDENE